MRNIAFIVVLTLAACCGFMCSSQPQPKVESTTPTEQSLREQSTDLLKQRGFTQTSEEGVWSTTSGGIVSLWKLGKVTIQPSTQPGAHFIGIILMDSYIPGDTKPHGSFPIDFVWQEATRRWEPMQVGAIINEGTAK